MEQKTNKKKVIIVLFIIIVLIASIVMICKKSNLSKSNKDANNLITNSTDSIEDKNNVETEQEEIPETIYNVKVPILCYHGVLDEAWGGKNLFVKVNEFEEQMKYLNENGYTTLFVSEIEKANRYEKPIILTFDDGYRDVYTNAFPILKRYNIKANIYVISGYVNRDAYMTTEMVQEMAKSPLIEVGSHTVNHSDLVTLTEPNIEEELRVSKEALEEMIGNKIDVIAYPNGSYDNRVINIAKNYYKYALSVINGKENPEELNTYDLRRIYVDRAYGINRYKNLF